jgi:tyrosine-specific transport protein
MLKRTAPSQPPVGINVVHRMASLASLILVVISPSPLLLAVDAFTPVGISSSVYHPTISKRTVSFNSALFSTFQQRQHSGDKNSLATTSTKLDLIQEQKLVRNHKFAVFSPVLSAALLVTSNTIGAGCLVLPDVAALAGCLPSAGLFIAAYAMNLASGVVMATVVIQQHEQQQQQQLLVNNNSSIASTTVDKLMNSCMSCIRVGVNMCVVAFAMSRIACLTPMDPGCVVVGWAALIAAVTAALTTTQLCQLASVAVAALVVSFGSLLGPGLLAVHDPLATILTPATMPGGFAEAAPVILMALVYQNIVPSVAKLLDYDRNKTIIAIALGSLIPLVLYMAWCFACLGGGVDRTVGLGGGALMTVFSLASLTGSSLGGVMSLAEELDTYMPSKTSSTDSSSHDRYQIASVLVSVAFPLAANVLLPKGQDFTSALALAGSFGSPLLYGMFPAFEAWKLRQSQSQEPQPQISFAALGMLGLCSTVFMGQELLRGLQSFELPEHVDYFASFAFLASHAAATTVSIL